MVGGLRNLDNPNNNTQVTGVCKQVSISMKLPNNNTQSQEQCASNAATATAYYRPTLYMTDSKYA